MGLHGEISDFEARFDLGPHQHFELKFFYIS